MDESLELKELREIKYFLKLGLICIMVGLISIAVILTTLER